MEGAMLYRKFPAYNSNVSSTIPSDNLVRSVRSFTIPITTNFGLFSQMLKVTLETFLMRRGVDFNVLNQEGYRTLPPAARDC